MEQFEKNRATLKDALRKLRSYAPPAHTWSSIDQRLDNSGEEDLPELSKLPTYAPPATVWNQLARQLDEDSTVRRPKLRIAWISGIAATLALLIVAGIAITRETPVKVSKHYSQETMEQFAITVDWTADDESFERLQEQLAQVNDPTINNLKVELDELNSAREEVEAIMHTYGTDPKLVSQLGEIERVRSDIYRQIIELI